jgi:CDGSH-type Zn-finger protein
VADQPVVTITVRANGNYRIEGPVRLVDAEGKEFKLERNPFSLCRCGQSSTKPFCDGTHTKIGFNAPTVAP